ALLQLTMRSIAVLRFFFFQAEGGIRDFLVTGVQTCALPISAICPGRHPVRVDDADPDDADLWVHAGDRAQLFNAVGLDQAIRIRSEERRVGKERELRRLRSQGDNSYGNEKYQRPI